MIDIHLLRVFVAVYKQQSFTRAAETLFLSQPTVSEHIKALEKQLGCKLFDRVNKKVYPTSHATNLYKKALQIIEMTDNLKEELIAQQKLVTGTVNIGASSIPAAYLLPNVVTKLKSLYKSLSFKIIFMDSMRVIDNILEQNLLLGLVGTKTKQEELDFIPFAEDELILIASPALINKSTINIRQIGTLPLILREQGSGTLTELMNALNKKGVSRDDLNIVAEFGNNEAVKQAVIEGLGVSFVSSLSVRNELKCNLVKHLIVNNLSIKRSFYIVKHKNRTLPYLYETVVKTLIEKKQD